MKRIVSVLVILSAVISTGCAFTDATLMVGFSKSNATLGPISKTNPGEISVGEFTDEREDKGRIGHKRNGYGQVTADIFTARSVEDIVEEGIVKALEHNNQIVLPTGNIEVRGEVTQFWFESDVNFWTIRFMGSVNCDISFVDKTTGEIIHSKSYLGHYEKETGGGWTETWTEVMNFALSNMVDSMVKDPKLASAFRAIDKQQLVTTEK
jgi:hypothetical protein